MARGTLDRTVTVVLNGSGNGTASIGPLSAREVWHVSRVAVSVSTDVNEALCSIYVGDTPLARNLRDTTSSGSLGDSTDSITDTVKVGDKVWAVWTGGDAGATATLVVTGTVDV
jgi:hypothetical protein